MEPRIYQFHCEKDAEQSIYKGSQTARLRQDIALVLGLARIRQDNARLQEFINKVRGDPALYAGTGTGTGTVSVSDSQSQNQAQKRNQHASRELTEKLSASLFSRTSVDSPGNHHVAPQASTPHGAILPFKQPVAQASVSLTVTCGNPRHATNNQDLSSHSNGVTIAAVGVGGQTRKRKKQPTAASSESRDATLVDIIRAQAAKSQSTSYYRQATAMNRLEMSRRKKAKKLHTAFEADANNHCQAMGSPAECPSSNVGDDDGLFPTMLGLKATKTTRNRGIDP